MQAQVKGTATTLIECWARDRPALIAEFGGSLASPDAQLKSNLKRVLGPKPRKVADLHDFSWSLTLWRGAALDTLKLALGACGAYAVVGYACLVATDPSIYGAGDGGRFGGSLDGWYFLSATLSTVGLGDYAPENQVSMFFW